MCLVHPQSFSWEHRVEIYTYSHTSLGWTKEKIRLLFVSKFPVSDFRGISSSVVFITSFFIFFKHVRLVSCWVHPMLSVNAACASAFSLIVLFSSEVYPPPDAAGKPWNWYPNNFLDIDKVLFFQTSHLTNLMSQWDFFSVVKVGATNVWDNVMFPSACRSHPLLPVHMLYCFQSIYEFFVISSSCDIDELQIGRVLISGDKSSSRHCACNMPNVTLAR